MSSSTALLGPRQGVYVLRSHFGQHRKALSLPELGGKYVHQGTTNVRWLHLLQLPNVREQSNTDSEGIAYAYGNCSYFSQGRRVGDGRWKFGRQRRSAEQMTRPLNWPLQTLRAHRCCTAPTSPPGRQHHRKEER